MVVSRRVAVTTSSETLALSFAASAANAAPGAPAATRGSASILIELKSALRDHGFTNIFPSVLMTNERLVWRAGCPQGECCVAAPVCRFCQKGMRRALGKRPVKRPEAQ